MRGKIDLDKLAEDELLREAKRGASRAAVGGALAWQKCPLQPTNKRFFANMVQYTVNANRLKEHQIRKSEITKHYSRHSVQKTNSPHSRISKRKRNRNVDACNVVHNDGKKQETRKRKAFKERDS